MARDWRDLFIVDGAAPAPPRTRRGGDRSAAVGRFRRLRESLRKTRQALTSRDPGDAVRGPQRGDLGAARGGADLRRRRRQTTAKVVEQLEREATEGELTAARRCPTRLAELLAEIAQHRRRPDRPARRADGDPGRRRQRHRQDDDGRQARLAPAASELGRTVRARRRRHVPRRRRSSSSSCGRSAPASDFVKGPAGRRSRARSPTTRVATGRRDGADVVIIDTAGRLHTQDDLMAELAKVRRVIAKQIPEAPHETLLTVDATTGQNGLRQAQLFSRGGRRRRARADQARRDRQGRDRARDRPRARDPGQADRGRRAARGSAAVRRREFARALVS